MSQPQRNNSHANLTMITNYEESQRLIIPTKLEQAQMRLREKYLEYAALKCFEVDPCFAVWDRFQEQVQERQQRAEATQFEEDPCFAAWDRFEDERIHRCRAERQVFGARDMTAAIETATKEVSSNVAQYGERITSTIERLESKISNSLSLTNETTQDAGHVLKQLAVAMTPVKIMWGTTDIVPILTKLGKVIVNFAMARDGWKMGSLFFNLACEFGSEMVTGIRNFLFTPVLELEDVLPSRHAVRQAFGHDNFNFGVFGEIENWISNNAKVTCTTLAAIIALVMQCCLGLPRNCSMEQMMKFFGDRCRNMKNIVDFGKTSWSLFVSTAEWLLEQIFPGTVGHELEAYLHGYSAWSRSVLALVDPKNPVAERVKKDKKLIYQINALYKQSMQYSATLGLLKVRDDLRDHYQKCHKLCEGFLREADHSGVLGNRPRVKPYIIHLFGESGVGKSGCIWPLACDLNSVLQTDLNAAKDPAAEIYFRNAEQEFWDGYAAQNVCVWDDFGQLTDTSAKPNPEFFEVIRAGNCAPYPLHMAQLEEKKRSKFVSPYVLLTSNVLNLQVSSLTFPAAYRRRVDLCVKVTIADEFCKEGTDKETGATVKRLDTTKVRDIDTRPYVFSLYNPESQTPICDDEGEPIKMTYDQLVERAIVESAKGFDRSIAFNEGLADRMTSDRHYDLCTLFRENMTNNMAHRQCINEPATEEDEEEEWESVAESTDSSPFPIEAQLEIKASVPKLLKKSMLDMLEKMKGYATIKNGLIAAGVILSGLGIWKLFSTEKKESERIPANIIPFATPEGFTSGDSKTHVLKVAKREVSYECLQMAQCKAVTRALRHELVSADGWCSWSTLIEHLAPIGITEQLILGIVAHDQKNRFECDATNKRIRARQGHTYEIDPELLFQPSDAKIATHFTYARCVMSILDNGIHAGKRTHVHLHPGHIRTPPVDLPGRTQAIWVDLTKCGERVWESGNGYIMMEYVPREAIVKCVSVATKQEAAVSGDSRTRVQQRARTEFNQREASVSGDSRTRAQQRARTEIEATKEAWADQTAQSLISHRILGNLYRVLIDGKTRLNGLFVRDTVMLTVDHLRPFLEEGKEITIINMFGAEFTVPISELKLETVKARDGTKKDALLMQFPRHVNAHSDLVKHFQEMPDLAQRKAQICLPTIKESRESRFFYVLGNQDCTIASTILEFEDGPVTMRDSLLYKLNTTEGDCGSPVIVNDSSFQRKIAGIHVAAYVDGHASVGQSVTRADLTRTLEQFKLITIDHDELPNAEPSAKAVLQIGTEYSKEDIVKQLNMPAETFGFIGKCSRITNPIGKTDIRPSPIHGFVTPTTKPAKLYSSEVNMLHRNMEKCAKNVVFIPEAEVTRAVNEVQRKLLSGESRKRLARVLTFEEAVSGSPESQYIDGITRQTSPGYPWVFKRHPSKPGKTTWFGTDSWEYSPEVKQAVEARLAAARLRHRLPVVWTDTLKDERRPIEKVNAFKTRVFAHGPMDYTIAFRMYFLGFIAHVMENRIVNEQSIGTNCFGPDWLRTAKHLQTHGKRVFAGDFSSFDGSLNSCIMSRLVEVVNNFYDDGPENATIREVLFLDVFNSVHLCGDKFIQLTHSQPSGNPITTILNSFYNSVSMRVAYYRCFDGKAPAFDENVAMVSYGDDNVVNFSSTVAEKFNQNTVTAAYATFDMVYTDETKSTGEVAPWRNLSEVNFLKRGFIEEDGQWRAPLDKQTILESCNWIRKTTDPVGASQQICETACRELAQYPPDEFKSETEKIQKAFYEATDQFILVQPRMVYLSDDSPQF